MIINAHCHRNFLDLSCVQVALYDDRLEVTSPGGLCYGLTLEEANDTQVKILDLLSEDTRFSAVKLAEQIGITSRNVEVNIKKLREKGILIRYGSPKNGYWDIARK